MVFLGLLLIGAPCRGQEYASASSHEDAVLELIELLDLEAINTQSREIMIESIIVQPRSGRDRSRRTYRSFRDGFRSA